ncbi:MAG: hypothetical protein VYD87_01245 [Pseudomonadota bacterium]|nr:hypothetical protein [Pseudomonadota bacterium]
MPSFFVPNRALSPRLVFAALIAAPLLIGHASPAAARVTFEIDLGPISDLDDPRPAAFAGFVEGETVRIRVGMDETATDLAGSASIARFEDPDADVFLIGTTSGTEVRLYGGFELNARKGFYDSAHDVTGTRVFFDAIGAASAAAASGAPWFIGNAVDWVSDGDFSTDINTVAGVLAGFLDPAVTLYGGSVATIRRPDDTPEDGGTLRIMRIGPLADVLNGSLAVPLPPAGAALAGGLVALVAAARRRRARPAH